uniref:Uncharacterized protein n=1 Tax=viral metagenome TaxID=1070528 RepID=A0A6C0AEC1_9ZZZZ
MSNQITYDKKKLIEKILKYYSEKEEKLTGKNKYFTNVEIDSNLTTFEGLSNDFRIGLITKLPLKSAKVVLAILQGILSENLYIFEPKIVMDEGIFKYFPDEENLEELIEKFEEFNLADFKAWVKLLENYLNEEIDVSEFLPEPETNYGLKKFKQKYFEISEINFNLRISKKGIVEILL